MRVMSQCNLNLAFQLSYVQCLPLFTRAQLPFLRVCQPEIFPQQVLFCAIELRRKTLYSMLCFNYGIA